MPDLNEVRNQLKDAESAVGIAMQGTAGKEHWAAILRALAGIPALLEEMNRLGAEVVTATDRRDKWLEAALRAQSLMADPVCPACAETEPHTCIDLKTVSRYISALTTDGHRRQE